MRIIATAPPKQRAKDRFHTAVALSVEKKVDLCLSSLPHFPFSLSPATAAEHFDYPIAWDIRDIISVDDVTESLGFGPNGGLVYAMEFLISNLDVFDDV